MTSATPGPSSPTSPSDTGIPDTPTHDAVVVGAGQAGPGVAAHLAGIGQRVAIVEADLLGGTCLNRGCRPTKALRASARVAHLARNAAAHGVHTGPVTVDLGAAVDRKDGLIDGWRDGFTGYLDSTEGIELVRGHARLAGSAGGLHRVAVDGPGGRVLAAPRVFLDTGSRPVVPRIPGLDTVEWLDNDGILHLREVPEHLVVLGGSYVGLEFAQMFARFGSRVTVLQRGPRLLTREDADIADELTRVLREEGLDVRTGVQVREVRAGGHGEGGGSGLTVHLGGAGAGDVEAATVTGSHLLVAVGRQPNTDDLGLDTVGLAPTEHDHLPTDGVFRTPVAGIWAMGDISGRGAFTHTAVQDSEIVVDHLRGGDRSADGRVVTYAVFTDPPLGRVGMNEAQARQSGRRVLAASYRMAGVTKAVLEGEASGLVKILVDADTDRFVGASVLGLFGDEVVQSVSAMIHADAPCRVLAEMLPVHPTVTEFWPTILGTLAPLDG